MTNQSIESGKRFAKTLTAALIAVFVIVSIFASVVFAADGSETRNVKIIIDAEETTVTTTETEPIEILTTSGIALQDTDRLDFSGYNETEGGSIVINRLKTINVEHNNVIESKKVYALTVGGALSEAGVNIEKNEMAGAPLDAPVLDGMLIKIKPYFTVKLKADGKTQSFNVIEGTVADLLKKAGVTLDRDDFTKPKLNKKLKAGMSVKVYRVSFKNKTVTRKIKFSTKMIEDEDLEIGKTKVVKKGKNGKKKVTYKIKYINGKKVKSTKINQVVTKKAKKKVVKVGTKTAEGYKDVEPNGVTSKWGYSVGQKISGKYTHYCACATCNGSNSGTTSSGYRIYNGMENPYYIACNWLPTGTVINVDGVNYCVVDRGGSGLSRVGRIDIFTPEGHAACYRYGTGPCEITIVRLGW
ncbi:MAG: G5 domain-containing protein [Eubacterium sp.]|nr:G5 domain-containing protein [Eubacterium sp.]